MAGPINCARTVLRTVTPQSSRDSQLGTFGRNSFHCHMNLSICVCFNSVCVVSYIGTTEIHVQLSFLKYGPATTSFSVE